MKINKTATVVLLCFLAVAGFILYQPSSPPAEFKTYKGLAGVSSNDTLDVKMQRMAEQAAMDAWARYHIHVSIDVNSLKTFDHYLDLVSQDQHFQNASPKDKQAEAIIDGAFVGEAIRRKHGGFWMDQSNAPAAEWTPLNSFPLNINGALDYPVTWCLKRLVNGQEDNIYDKYTYFVLQKTNEFDGDITYWTNTPSGLQELTNKVTK